MIGGENIAFKTLCACDCTPDLLNHFNRYQEVHRSWRKENNEWQLKDHHFIEQWDNAKKQSKILLLLECLKHGGQVFGAFSEGRLIGFASVNSNFLGQKNEYIELVLLHVSYEYRNKGIGKRLFLMACNLAKEKGAKKLYISSNPAEETQAFYAAVGCVKALETLGDNAPGDFPLEYRL
jgi:GNAT superfamily N-acetyltransferase